MGANYILINEQTLNASASSVTFSSIPQTGYTDLVVKISPRVDNANWIGGVNLTFNSSRTTNLLRLFATNGSVYSDTNVGNGQGEAGLTAGATATASTFASTEIYIPNYTSTSPKSYSVDTVVENNSGSDYLVALLAGLNSSVTTGITSITFSTSGYNFVAGSTFSLYGVAAVGTTPTVVPKASGGDIVVNDGTYWYHAFLSSGTFIPNTSLSCDYLVVAGGGGGGGTGNGTNGGYSGAGGGGAGGLRSTVTATGGGGSLESPISLSATSYAITVGAGGAGGTYLASTSGNGSNSSIASTIVSTGGGGVAAGNGQNGGSGGGAYGNNTVGTGTSGQGYSGTQGTTGDGGTGGGGAGAAPASKSGNTGSAGGAGVAISTFASATGTGVSNYYAGGGGAGSYLTNGGAGGSGGGAAGGTTGADPSAATVNSGGGGGGATQRSTSTGLTGSNGGSGIVIIRYAMA